MTVTDLAIREIIPEFTHDVPIIALWRLGLDTVEIAEKTHLPRYQVANRLARLRDAGAA